MNTYVLLTFYTLAELPLDLRAFRCYNSEQVFRNFVLSNTVGVPSDCTRGEERYATAPREPGAVRSPERGRACAGSAGGRRAAGSRAADRRPDRRNRQPQ